MALDSLRIAYFVQISRSLGYGIINHHSYYRKNVSNIAILSLYIYFRKVCNKFEALGIKKLPIIPMFGSMTPVIFNRESIAGVVDRHLRALPDDKMVGFYEFTTPLFLINDVKLFKKITTKDFEYFVDKRSVAGEINNPLFTRNLLALKGETWKSMRLTLSPAFTGSKLRSMVPVMVDVTNHMVDRLKNKINESEAHHIDVESKNILARCLMDMLASCVYGIKVNSIDGDNEFYTNCKEATNLTTWDLVKIMIFKYYPTVARVLKWKMKPELSKFITDLVLDVMTYRKEHNIVRNDVMHILEEASKEWSNEYLVPQAVFILLAGFETVSTGLTFLLYELALHPEVQDRLYQEIRENNEANNGNFHYNSVQSMTYLDMVLTEGLRLWPPVLILDRKCVKDYNLGKPNDDAKSDVIIRKNEEIFFNIWTVDRDPRYFPDPEKFDPERFSETNKQNIKPFTFLPFGAGPRGCMGARFALMEMKVLLYLLLLNVEVTKCERSCVQLEVHDALPRIKGGHWLRIKLRNE